MDRFILILQPSAAWIICRPTPGIETFTRKLQPVCNNHKPHQPPMPSEENDRCVIVSNLRSATSVVETGVNRKTTTESWQTTEPKPRARSSCQTIQPQGKFSLELSAKGAFPKFEKTKVFPFLPFFAVFSKSKNSRGAAWRYVALSQILKKNKFFCTFAVFVVFKKCPKTSVALWCHVALSRKDEKKKDKVFLHFFAVLSQFSKKREVAIWRCARSKKQVFQPKCRGALWRCPKLAIFSKCKKQFFFFARGTAVCALSTSQ